jgi:hypothetical protein
MRKLSVVVLFILPFVYMLPVHEQKQMDWDKVQVKLQKLSGNVYMIEFVSPTGGNAGARGSTTKPGPAAYHEGREVAALVYQRRKHFINVFVWPDANGTNSTKPSESRHGFNVMKWSRDGFQFWAISDVSAPDLAEFIRLLQAGTPPQPK